MKALLIIDYTNDFVAPDGALTCGLPGQTIAPRIIDLATEFYQRGDAVILPTDLHQANDPYHPETSLFPPHNLAGTPGRAFYGPLADWYHQYRQAENVWAYPKNRYSSFANSNLDNYLRSRHITDLHLTGVCTDICVLHTAIDAYNLDYQLTIHADAVASFSPAGHTWALGHFKNALGATVTPSV
ncbi:cysteine hydrolase family protein [Weissella halotolerans]|uniref:Hydrolase isocharismatase nicotinamidase family protein n=1 Tax=Weissella halotolerans DSM 20190 TaxID=1123500 RepID=A0A0R2FUY5_9LACO|nr:isochorismatase family cysteine hydrolase [Weissella halotolerans]KRN32207.1 hydrolase isocharismatase nicotinamidase family protein [Weissella halotolerans DSM 20190]